MKSKKHLTERERYYLEVWFKEGKPVPWIAKQLNKNESTIYRERKRGLVTLRNKDWTERTEYLAASGQRIYKENKKNCGRKLKLCKDDEFLMDVKNLIIKLRYSPEAVIYTLKEHKVCIKTVYNYIHREYIDGLTIESLPYATKKKKKKKKKGKSVCKSGGRSIEERPKEIEKRLEYGHWEMDTVYSSHDDKHCLLVFTERMTREELIFKIKDRTACSVIKCLDSYERKIGAPSFRNIFKTITCDNGMEFSRMNEIERSCLNKQKRTTVYFCHPYCSCERGSNENANKFIRRWIPKGDDIGLYTSAEIQLINDWVNRYPRKLFNGLSSTEYKKLIGVS